MSGSCVCIVEGSPSWWKNIDLWRNWRRTVGEDSKWFHRPNPQEYLPKSLLSIRVHFIRKRVIFKQKICQKNYLNCKLRLFKIVFDMFFLNQPHNIKRLQNCGPIRFSFFNWEYSWTYPKWNFTQRNQNQGFVCSNSFKFADYPKLRKTIRGVFGGIVQKNTLWKVFKKLVGWETNSSGRNILLYYWICQILFPENPEIYNFGAWLHQRNHGNVAKQSKCWDLQKLLENIMSSALNKRKLWGFWDLHQNLGGEEESWTL